MDAMELNFKDSVDNVQGVLDTLISLQNDLTEDDELYWVANDAKDCREFISHLEDIIKSACLFAALAGADEACRIMAKTDDNAYEFGSDSNYYIQKYINNAVIMCESYGTEDYHETFYKHFQDNIKPM